MEKAYWIGRKRASLKLAEEATSSQARLVHYDLAGRYSVKAMSAETETIARTRARSANPVGGAEDESTSDA